LINILAHKSLLSVFGEGHHLIKQRHVKRARKDTEGARRLHWFWW
jgi:MSHA biogenesis protein MshM